jgi:alkanesulfonate monooxygenase SsuD/methylene tetrahydromethanopterin reductase-like flavin-dependent oxidoreductase (luciferase family)
MEYGIFALMSRRDLERSAERTLEEGIELIVAAEGLGYESVWLAEHHFSSYSVIPNPLLLAVKLAERTRRIILGTAVLVPPFYSALRMAEDVIMTDVLTGGRLRVGVGRGYQRYEFERYGLSVDDARGLFEENMEVLRLALTQRTFSFEGRYVQVPETAMQIQPIQQPHPEVWVAVSTPETIAWAVERDYALITSAGARPTDHIRRVRREYDQQLRAAGRPLARARFALQRYVYVTDDRADALEAAQHVLWTYRVAENYRAGSGPANDGIANSTPRPQEPTPEELVERLIFGDPETCIRKLQQDVDDCRPTHLSLVGSFGGFGYERSLRSLRRLAEEVLPHIKEPVAVS